MEVAVVRLETRRFGARRDALVALERERSVRRRAASLDPELLFGVRQQLVAAVEKTSDRRAHVDQIATDVLHLEHLVEARSTDDLGRRTTDEFRDMFDGVLG